MGMTITEKILAQAAGKDSVAPGDNIWVEANVLMSHDVCGPGTIGVFKREFGENAKVWDKEGIVLIPDHYIFTADEKCHRNVDVLRQFVKEQDLPYFYDPANETYSGVCHVTLPEKGHTRPGEILFGTDSHTCTHGALGMFATGIGNTDAGFVMGTGKLLIKVPQSIKFVIDGELDANVTAKDIILRIIGDIGVDGATYCAMEFAGSTIEELSIEERMTICNMAIEAGGKNGIIAPDNKTIEFVKSKTDKEFKCYESDEDANYSSVYHYNAEDLKPVVAMPYSPDKKGNVADLLDYKLDRSYIGSCTGGKIEDFAMAAKVLYKKSVKIDTYIIPATVEVEAALKELKYEGISYMDIFESAGCIIKPPSCAACLGGPVDTHGRCNGSEVCISTTNRNFPGRMGSKESKTILASPLTAAASALTGFITDAKL